MPADSPVAPKRVLVTGSAGYIGRLVVQKLLADGHDVVGVDDNRVDAPCTSYSDICQIAPEFFDGVESIIHLGGVSYAPDRTDLDHIIFKNNIEGTRIMLNRAEEAGVSRFILASTASVFEGLDGDKATLDTQLYPNSPYGQSKANAERLVRGSNIAKKVAFRKGTIAGIGTDPDPEIMRWDLVVHSMNASAMKTGTINVTGDGTMQRPLLHVDRAATLYADAATKELADGYFVYNAADDNCTIGQIAEEVAKLTGATINYRPMAGRPRNYHMDNVHTDGLLLPNDVPGRSYRDMVNEIFDLLTAQPDLIAKLPDDPFAHRRGMMDAKLQTV